VNVTGRNPVEVNIAINEECAKENQKSHIIVQLEDGSLINLVGVETSFLSILVDKTNKHLAYLVHKNDLDKKEAVIDFLENGSNHEAEEETTPPDMPNGEESTWRDLEYNYKKVGKFRVDSGKVGRTVWFESDKDYPNDVEPISNLKDWLDDLLDMGVTYKFHNDMTSAFMVSTPSKYGISELLRRTSIAYDKLKEGFF